VSTLLLTDLVIRFIKNRSLSELRLAGSIKSLQRKAAAAHALLEQGTIGHRGLHTSTVYVRSYTGLQSYANVRSLPLPPHFSFLSAKHGVVSHSASGLFFACVSSLSVPLRRRDRL